MRKLLTDRFEDGFQLLQVLEISFCPDPSQNEFPGIGDLLFLGIKARVDAGRNQEDLSSSGSPSGPPPLRIGFPP